MKNATQRAAVAAAEEVVVAGGGGRGGAGADPRNFNPDSSAFVFARDHNLYLVEVGKPDTIKITSDGAEDYSFGARDTTENRRQLNALAGGGGQQQDEDGDTDTQDQGSGRDMRVRAAATWAPDGKAFSIVRRDQRLVKELYLVNTLANPRPVLLHYKYTMPGEENVTQTELWVYKRGDKAARKLNVAKWKDQTISDIHWPISSEKLRLLRRDRPQRKVDVIEIDLATNASKSAAHRRNRQRRAGAQAPAIPQEGWRLPLVVAEDRVGHVLRLRL